MNIVNNYFSKLFFKQEKPIFFDSKSLTIYFLKRLKKLNCLKTRNVNQINNVKNRLCAGRDWDNR